MTVPEVKEIDDSETRKELCKMFNIPYPVEPNPNAIKEMAGCLDFLVSEDETVDSVKLVRELRGK